MRLVAALLLAVGLVSNHALAAESVVEALIVAEVRKLAVTEGSGQRFTRLSTVEGLSQTRVAQIVQDEQGYIWFGTQFGLNRYDGYDFRTFVHDNRNADSIGAVFVTALFRDSENMLWVGGAGTLDRFDPVTEIAEHIALDPPTTGQSFPTVVHISEDRDGAIWLATGEGLYRRDPSALTFRRFVSDPDVPDSLSASDIRFTGQDRTGAFWVGTTKGLDRFDPDTGKVTLHVPLPDPVQVSFYEDQKGNFWVLGASGSGLARLDRATNILTRYSFYDVPPGPNDLTGVMAMVEDETGALWIGSPGMGLMRFEPEAGQVIHYGTSPSDPGTIPEDKVIGLFKDREGNIWAGHHSTPPSHFNPRQRLFETFRRGDGRPDSLQTDFVNAMFKDDRGRLWIGNDFGLTLIDRQTGRYTRFSDGLTGKPMVITIVQDRAGDIWVGTYGNGIARLDERSGRFESFTHDPDDPASLASNQVHRLFVARDGTLWAGTGDGLSRFIPETGRFATYKANPSDSHAQTYVSIAEDAHGILWLGTHYSGLHRFDPASGEIRVFSSDPGTAGTLRDNMVPDVHIGRDGIIWVGTQSGLDRLDPQTGVFTAIHESPTTPDRTISHILEDRAGTLWIGTNKGVLHFNPADGSFVAYQAIVGLSGNDFTGWATGFQSADGEMFLGGFSGGIAFFPDQLSRTQSAMNILLTGMEFPFLSDKDVERLTSNAPIGVATSLSLGFEANSFNLRFAAPSYVNPVSTRYRYKLEGLEDDWREVDAAQRTAIYTTLPPGDYVFRVQAASARDGWSSPGIALPIEIRPPWWQMWWFRTVCILGLAGLVLAAFKIRTAQIEEREREFRKLAENAPDMVLRFDCDMRLLYANSAARAFIGPDAAAAISRPVAELAGFEARLPVRLAAVRAVRDSRIPETEEFQISHASGLLDLEARIVPEGPGAASRLKESVLVIVRDITRRKTAEAARRRAENDLAHAMRVATVGELTASIAHEINQPLTGIVTNGEAGRRWLTATPPNLAEVTQIVERIIADGRRAADIIARIGALVRKTEPKKGAIDINDTIRESVLIAGAETRRSNVTVRLDLAKERVSVLGDRVQVQQVLLNLIGNALEAMAGVESGDRILTISTRQEDGKAEITVADTGPGLTATASEEVFTAFYSTKRSGMGMGLAISRSIVAAHDGEIAVTANRPSGCIFKVTLPLLESGQAADSSVAAA